VREVKLISPRGTHSIIAFAAAALVVSGPAAAQGWEKYSYPEYAFSVSFPPIIGDLIARRLPARVYSARQDKGQFKMTVADLASTGLDERPSSAMRLRRCLKAPR
jgi:hypothetical protein